MKPSIICASALVLTVGLAGCDLGTSAPKYSIVESGKRAFLLNTQTGDTQEITLAGLKPVQSAKAKLDIETAVKRWPSQNIPPLPGVTVSVRTKHRDGRMFYIAEAGPVDGPLAGARAMSYRSPQFILSLNDGDAFAIGEDISIKFNEATTVLGGPDNKPSSIQWEGSVIMPYETYSAATSLTIRWAGIADAAKKE